MGLRTGWWLDQRDDGDVVFILPMALQNASLLSYHLRSVKIGRILSQTWSLSVRVIWNEILLLLLYRPSYSGPLLPISSKSTLILSSLHSLLSPCSPKKTCLHLFVMVPNLTQNISVHKRKVLISVSVLLPLLYICCARTFFFPISS